MTDIDGVYFRGFQQCLSKASTLRKPYSYGPYNKIKGDKQAIRITEGCVWNCPNCYEPTTLKVFEIPPIERNHVLIFDMNLLCKSEALDIIRQLADIRIKCKPVYYELVCGIDYRFLTQKLANALYDARFGYVGFDRKIHKNNRTIRLAWDQKYSEQFTIKKAIDMLVKAGYKRKDVMVFMQCNYLTCSFAENCLKLDLCKVWGVRVCDCYFDGQIGSRIQSVYWSEQEIKAFRAKVRKHNQLINFGFDPEIKEKL
jgi:hypothetical protein